MKKLLICRHVFLLFFYCFSLNGYSQTHDKASILGTVTIDEKGQVTVQSFSDQEKLPAKVLSKTGKLPLKSSELQEILKPAGKTETSGANSALKDTSSEKSMTGVPQDNRSFSSTETDVQRFENADITNKLKSAEVMAASSYDVKAEDFSVQKIYQTSQDKPMSSTDPVLDYKGSFKDDISVKGTLAEPNLAYQSGSGNLTVTGTTVNISLTVINNGTSSAVASELGYYLSPDILITTTPNYLIGTDAVPSLAIGGTSAETHSVDVAASSIPCGTYYVFFCIDHLKQVAESNENDNDWYFTTTTVTIPCTPNLDLASGTASLTISGNNVSIALTVINNGSTTAAASELGYYLSPDLSITTTPNYLIGTDAVSSLAVGGTSAESITVNVAELSIPCGTYYVIFFIDRLGQVAESNENDNTYYWSSPAVVIPCTPNLDLATGTASLTVTGTNVSIAATAINNGSATAGASVLGYYLSPDASLTTTPNYLIGTDAVPSLAIGGTSAQTLTVNVSALSIPCGTYFVFFYFDYLGQVAESNESDNIWYFSSPTVTIPCVPNLDLASGTSSLTVTGTNVSIAVTAINNGSATAGASVLGYYLSPDALFTTTPNYLIGTDPVPSLAIGGTSAQTLVMDVSQSSIPCGTYYVFFFIDHLNQVTESNETDNTWYFSSPTVTIPCVPNLDLASGTGSLTATGTNVSISVSVINNGSTTAGTSELGYYLSPDVSFTTTPNYLIGTDAVPALVVGGTSAQTHSVDVLTVTPLIPCGTYYVFFNIDRLNQVTESNESDNIWYFSSPLVTVPSRPNLTYQSGSGSITVSGTTVTLGYTVINNGNCSSSACNTGYYLSPDNSLTTIPNYFIGSSSIPALGSGGTSPQTFTKDVSTVTPSIPVGTYYVFFSMDYLGVVAESNENDNAWYFTSPQVTISPNCTLLSVTPSNQSVSSSAGSTSFSVTTTGSSCSWTAVSNQSWCTISPSSGSGNGTIVASYTANTTSSARVATITVTVPGLSPVNVTVTQTYPPTGTKTLGNTEVYSLSSTTANRRAQTVTFPEPGTIQSISIYHNGGTGRVLLGVYDDVSGSPGGRLGMTPETVINASAGWQTVPLTSPVVVTAGQKVWLSWVFENNPGVRYIAGTPARAQSAATWPGGMPNPFGASTFANYKYSAYCSYVAGGPGPVTKTLGNTTVYGSTSTTANRRAQTVTFPEAGTMQSISIYHNGGTGSVILGVYADAGGAPGARLGVTPSTVINAAAGWQTISLSSPVGVTSGQKVWLSWVFQTNPGIRYIAGTPARAESPQVWAGGMPDPFGTASFGNYKYSLYCTYTTGTGPVTKNLGNTEVYSLSSTTANRRAQTVTFPEAGTIESISIYHNGGTGQVLLGVYADASGAPGARLGVTAATVINATAGWQTIPLTGTYSVASGQKVWLSWVFENNPGVRYIAGTPARAQSTALWAGGMPDPFGAATFANYKYSLYCTYSTGSGDEIKDMGDDVKSLNTPVDINSVLMDKDEVLIYPNPTEGDMTVTWKNRYSHRLDITIYNILGKAVKEIQTDPDVNEIRLDLNGSSNGIYLFEMKDKKNDLILNRSRIIKK